MRPVAFLVASLSLVQLLGALVLSLPHTDVPCQPMTSLVVAAVALSGFALARAVWRGRRGTARWLPLWGLGMALFAVGLVLVVSSPDERRGAAPALAAGLSLWAGCVWLTTRYVRRRVEARA